MPRFIRSMLTTFDAAGLPSQADADWQWLNLDHIERLQEHIHTEPPTPGDETPVARYVAFLVLTMCSGDLLALPAGIYDSEDAALDGLVHTRTSQLGAR